LAFNFRLIAQLRITIKDKGVIEVLLSKYRLFNRLLVDVRLSILRTHINIQAMLEASETIQYVSHAHLSTLYKRFWLLIVDWSTGAANITVQTYRAWNVPEAHCHARLFQCVPRPILINIAAENKRTSLGQLARAGRKARTAIFVYHASESKASSVWLTGMMCLRTDTFEVQHALAYQWWSILRSKIRPRVQAIWRPDGILNTGIWLYGIVDYRTAVVRSIAKRVRGAGIFEKGIEGIRLMIHSSQLPMAMIATVAESKAYLMLC